MTAAIPSDDERFMAAALSLGRRGLGVTTPNPSVGAVVVKDGVVVGRGCTARGGRPHGETIALAEAGAAAAGATIYVTLEPCSHQGRTGPCCVAIVAAGIARLVYAIEDPNPLVGGRGAAYCRQQGLAVTEGICADEARRAHRAHITMTTRNRPMVTLKLAETADGFAAGDLHDPRLAITGAAANGAVHVMRAMHDAIMVGVGTILADDPLMTVRLPGVEAKPLRIVLDPMARTPPRSRLLQTAREAPVLVLIGHRAPRERRAGLDAIAGAEIVVMEEVTEGRFDLAAALREIGKRAQRVFSEGGPTVAAALIDHGLVDDVLIFTAQRPHGGEGLQALSPNARATLANPECYRRLEDRDYGVDRLRHYESLF